jgi:hypothetical protein
MLDEPTRYVFVQDARGQRLVWQSVGKRSRLDLAQIVRREPNVNASVVDGCGTRRGFE